MHATLGGEVHYFIIAPFSIPYEIVDTLSTYVHFGLFAIFLDGFAPGPKLWGCYFGFFFLCYFLFKWYAKRKSPMQVSKFSRIEILIIISVIIAILIGGTTVINRRFLAEVKPDRARRHISSITVGLDAFYKTYGRYPTNEEGLAVLIQVEEKMPEMFDFPAQWQDPWGNPYHYRSPGSNSPYEVICYGRDGREGGEGLDADISSNE